MEPFTTNQAIIVALLFLLGIAIGMFFLAGGKWKGRYRSEVARREELERENQRLGGEVREYESLRHAAAKAPAPVATHSSAAAHETVVHRDEVRTGDRPVGSAYRQNSPTTDGPPDVVIRRP